MPTIYVITYRCQITYTVNKCEFWLEIGCMVSTIILNDKFNIRFYKTILPIQYLLGFSLIVLSYSYFHFKSVKLKKPPINVDTPFKCAANSLFYFTQLFSTSCKL